MAASSLIKLSELNTMRSRPAIIEILKTRPSSVPTSPSSLGQRDAWEIFRRIGNSPMNESVLGQLLRLPQMQLPDQQMYERVYSIKYIDGANDGIDFFHGPRNPQIAAENAALAKSIFEDIRNYVEFPQKDRLAKLYDRLVFGLVEKLILEDGQTINYQRAVISWAFDFMQVVLAWCDQTRGSGLVEIMHKFAEQLIVESADRNPVKIGLLLLSALSGTPITDKTLEDAIILGRQEEFTWFASRVLYQQLAEPVPELWDLAFHTRGWGRIMAVHVITCLGELPDACRWWLLRYGWENEVDASYTAITIAQNAYLLNGLQTESADNLLMRGAEQILTSIVTGKAHAVNLDSWADAPEVFGLYRKHADRHDGKFATQFIPSGW